jgi:hypothetical protein
MPFSGEMACVPELLGCLSALGPFAIAGVFGNMLPAFHQFQILDPIIQPVAIDVVDMKASALRYVPMVMLVHQPVKIAIADATRCAWATAVITVRPVNMKPNTLKLNAAVTHCG